MRGIISRVVIFYVHCVFFQITSGSGRTPRTNRRARYSLWSTRFIPWLMLYTTCTKISVPEKLASAPRWIPSTARCCSSTSAMSTSQVCIPNSTKVASAQVVIADRSGYLCLKTENRFHQFHSVRAYMASKELTSFLPNLSWTTVSSLRFLCGAIRSNLHVPFSRSLIWGFLSIQWSPFIRVLNVNYSQQV